MPKKILLITPPFSQLNTPYPASPCLKGVLTLHGYDVAQADLGIELITKILSREGFQKVFEIVKEGMLLVVHGAGTATGIRMKEITIAGKTGTAQNPHGKDHAFFIGFAPYENPKIAIAVVVENVGFGATWAAPIVKKMIEAYLMKEKIKKEKEEIMPKIQEKIIGASIAD
jgi:membrane carboxypeptidase/penicillin-binding protein